MNKKEIKKKINFLKSLQEKEEWDKAHKEAEELIKDLFSEKKYKDIVNLDKALECIPISFEVAYSYAELEELDKAEEIYDLFLSIPGEENNTAVLNNLSNIKKDKGQIESAYDLIKRAYDLAGDDEIIKRNYENLLRIMQEKEEIDHIYKNAENNLKKETNWAVEKLKTFLINVQKEKEYRDNKIPIPNWKFKVLIGTDELKADSLKKQWIEKGYIRDTRERGNYSVHIYEINPYLQKFLQKSTPVQINQEWFDGFENINIEKLNEIEYFEILTKIKKVNKKYRELIKRDFDELVFNYLVRNKKSTIILSGSFIEALFTYYCEKKKVKTISYTLNTKKINKDLYDCTLADFLNYFELQREFKKIIVYIGNLSRVYRNFIHPGNEIKNKESLGKSKLELCFNAVLEITRYILK
ncbi:MAG: tetratricopeptide repeat protein [Candidatus Nealsonbacteria bacterium]